ncbi:AmpG family muropeptide MFS transporter [Microbaculum sp. FT89]|uniref:AmpG family muropeptide MFS transporter n=1 Tax=Microbaculum sp. FT89 TaxID=3447298 RepID=UPI003F530764
MPPSDAPAAAEGIEPRKPLPERLAAALAVFLERRVLVILFLGFSSGLPLALSGSTLAIRMTDVGVDLGTIGLFSLVGLPYTVKFLWAPLVDATRVPVLSRWLGRRRGWLVFTQLLLMAAIVYLGFVDPLVDPWFVALGAVLVAAASATQDIVIDAYRVESLKTEEQAAGMAWFVSAYRIGMLISTAGCVSLVAILEGYGVDTMQGWSWAYAAMAVFVLIGTGAALAGREPMEPEGMADDRNAAVRVGRTAVDAFAEFLGRKDAIAVLAFVVLYKFCDAFAGVMTGPFVISIGFDKLAYAGIVKGVGLFAVLAGGFAGGFMLRAMSMVTMLWIAGFLQMGSNLVFVWQAIVGVNTTALAVTIAVENFTGGIGTVIFVAYLSSLCNDARHTATQFALLTALAAVGRTVLAANAGYAAEAFGWATFFAITALAAIPGLALLWWLQLRGHFDKPKAAPASRPAG